MKRITYAGESVLTSNDIGSILVALTAAMAKNGLAEAVIIPICDESGHDHRTAELVIGQGNDVLAVPQDGDAPEPDFSQHVQELQNALDRITKPASAKAIIPDRAHRHGQDTEVSYDYELELAETHRFASDAEPK